MMFTTPLPPHVAAAVERRLIRFAAKAPVGRASSPGLSSKVTLNWFVTIVTSLRFSTPVRRWAATQRIAGIQGLVARLCSCEYTLFRQTRASSCGPEYNLSKLAPRFEGFVARTNVPSGQGLHTV